MAKIKNYNGRTGMELSYVAVQATKPKKKAKNKTTVAKPQLKQTKREGSENGTGHYGVHRVVTLSGGGVDQ